MLLRENTIEQFNKILASSEPAPGGGSAAALSGTLGAALLSMVCELTLAKEKYASYHCEILEILNAAKRLHEKLLLAIDEDTEAFNKVSAVFSMPKDTPEQKAERSSAMQSALKSAALLPLLTMRTAYNCLELCGKAEGKVNTSCLSDFGSSVLCSIAGVRAAWLNVKINISGIKDEKFQSETSNEAQKILNSSEKLAEELYKKIEQAI